MRTTICLAAAAVILAGCGKTPEPQKPVPKKPGQPAAAVVDGGCVVAGAPCAFTVSLSFTPAAAAKLAGLHEQVEVAADYFGLPVATAKNQADEMGQINLGRETVDVRPVAGAVAMSGKPIDAGKLPLVENGMPSLLINVYSARKANPDNLLNCGIFEDTLSVARKKPIAIHCALITEG